MASNDKGLEEIPEGAKSCVEHLILRRVGSAHMEGGNFQRPNLTEVSITGQIESNYDEVTDSFDSMNLKSELLRGEKHA